MLEHPSIAASPEELQIVLGILERHVPDREVWAFGSRAKGPAKQYSDLDITVIGDEPLSLGIMADLRDAFAESPLPFKVDIVDWATTRPRFREAIASAKVIVKSPSRREATR